jgi:hypothetical protein
MWGIPLSWQWLKFGFPDGLISTGAQTLLHHVTVQKIFVALLGCELCPSRYNPKGIQIDQPDLVEILLLCTDLITD